MSRVRDVLREKGSQVTTIPCGSSVRQAAELMHQRHIGAVLVMDGDTIAGIFTERDLLNRIVAARRDADVTPVDEVMTERVAFCEPDTTLESCRTTMTRNKLRHLPVVHDGRLVGIISSGDILARELHDQEETIRYLHEYMHGHV